MVTTSSLQVLKTGELVAEASSFWGSHFKYAKYPEGIDLSLMDAFVLPDNLPKVPRFLWDRLVSLYFDYADQSLEVHGRIVLDPDKNDWKILIPFQEVTAGSVSYNYSVCFDLLTGQRLRFPEDLPFHYVVWETHSHNTMPLKTPSTIDDKNELSEQIGYCIISTIDVKQRTYKTCFTVVRDDGRPTIEKANQFAYFGWESFDYVRRSEPKVQYRRYFINDADVGGIVEGLTHQDHCVLNTRLRYPEIIKTAIKRWVYVPPKVQIAPPVWTVHSPLPAAHTVKVNGKDDSLNWSLSDELHELEKMYGKQALFQAVMEYFQEDMQ